MKKSHYLMLAVLLCAISSFYQAAQAGSLEDGIKLYTAKDYRGALPHFELAARNSPMLWQTHFYLASSLLATGDLARAKAEFTMASKLTSNPEIGKRCREGLDRVNKRMAGGSSTSTARTSSTSSTSSSAYSPAAAEAEKNLSGNAKKRDEIMMKARLECAAIQKEAAEQTKGEKDRSNTKFKYQDGSVGYDISDDREADIKRDADERCKRIMEIAEQSVKSYK